MKARAAALVATLAVALLAVPLVAEAQPAARTPRIGVLAPDSRAAATSGIEAFGTSLRELGYVEGRTITVEVRWADGRAERLPRWPP
jgi:putative ABC transport system substrate-binding protein